MRYLALDAKAHGKIWNKVVDSWKKYGLMINLFKCLK